ncbi:MBOAT family O-acyltransferase [Oscillospiraceae bacterium LCP25S3_E10]
MDLSALLMAGRFDTMTSYFAVIFLVAFLPICIIVYSIIPQKTKKYFLLFASMVFFWLVSGQLIVYLILTIMSVHYFGIWLDRIQGKRNAAVKAAPKEERKALKKVFLHQSRLVLLFATVIHIGVLLVIKYSPFFTTNVNNLFTLLNVPLQLDIPSYIMPIGISFFTLQAISYLFDVYRGLIKADDNIFRLALFMSFFPQIVEGPICRYGQTADQLWNVKQIEFENLKLGAQRILFGLMKKLVIADRLNPLIKEVFSNYSNYQGGIIAIAAVCYTIQLYMDFSGTMDAVMGIAQIFGVTMPENFQRPFFSKSISEFWQRWHITLGTWFKDYIFYPVTMSKPMKNLTSSARKRLGNHFGPLLAGSVALFCVWFCNGLWHGSAWNYIFFGMYHFALILAGNIISPAVTATNKKLHINAYCFAYRTMQMVRTTILVIIGELFFRAEGLKDGLAMFGKMVTDFSFSTLDSTLMDKLKIDVQDIIIVAVALVIIFVISVLNEKGINIRLSLKKKNIVIRWGLLFALIMFIVIFGAYGKGYVPVDPIYANF